MCLGESADRIGDFDRARRHYVAFAGASNLLVLTASVQPQATLSSIWESASPWRSVDRGSLSDQLFGNTETRPG